MPPAASAGSSRPLQKKQARRSLAEINAILEASSPDNADDPDPQQPTELQQQQPEHPMMAFINLMLKDLNVQDPSSASGRASPDSSSTAVSSPAPPRSPTSRYREQACLTKIVHFCAILPDWPQLQTLLRNYLWHVDWKFLITSQDLIQDQMKDLWSRVIRPVQSQDHRGDADASRISFQPGDLSRLALLACVLGETVESMAPDATAELLPASRSGVVPSGPVNVDANANPRVKALLLLTYHVPALIEECLRLDELTIDLVQANISAFSLWSNQGLHGTGSTEFPRWNVTIRAAKSCNLFEDPGSNSNYSQFELDHRRRLAWLVYGYDHAFAVGANTKPLIVESQFSVDQPGDAAPWAACGAPPDPCLARLEMQGGLMAQLVSSTLCYGPPLHRKAMETDKKISDMLAELDPSYHWDNPDLSFDTKDPFRARRRCWLQLTTAWQRGSLHRQFFFPNGRITNGELATSRHIATDSALRSIFGVRDLRKMQNRFSDHMGSAWWYQYFTEPCMTLATGALLLIRSKGQGVPGLSDETNCWTTLMHFTRIIDECIQDLDASTRDAAACLPSLLTFAQGCLKLIKQLRSAVQTSFDAFVQSQPDLVNLANLKDLEIDQNIIPLLHPRSRQKSPGSGSQKHAHAQSSESSSSSSSNHTPKQGTKRIADGTKRGSAANRSRKSIGHKEHDVSHAFQSSQPAFAESLSVSPRTSIALSAQPSNATSLSGYASASTTASGLTSFSQTHNSASASPSHTSPQGQLPPGTLSLSFGPEMGFPGPAQPDLPQGSVNASAVSAQQLQQPIMAAAPPFGVPAFVPEGHLLSPAEPFALRDFYSDDGVQRGTGGRGLADWIASVQMDVMLPNGQQ
uniref:Transcription factor domain-containing protein n=1 Tax=Kalmanozyma brasiliensis (strain GHG001) TaxID=1365824 RepID=V5GSC3_KALBG